jgi:hypothetical protein
MGSGLLPQPLGPQVSTSASAPLQGCHHLQLQRLSKRRQVHQCLRLLLVEPYSFKKGTHL